MSHDVNPDAMRHVIRNVDSVVRELEEIAEYAYDPDDDIGGALRDILDARDRLKRHGNNAAFDVQTKQEEPS